MSLALLMYSRPASCLSSWAWGAIDTRLDGAWFMAAIWPAGRGRVGRNRIQFTFSDKSNV